MSEIQFSHQQLAQIANSIDFSTESLKEVQKAFETMKSEFNKTDTTLVQDHWDARINNDYLKKLNDTATKLIDEISDNITELTHRQEDISQLIVAFAQENAANEEETAAAVNAEETE